MRWMHPLLCACHAGASGDPSIAILAPKDGAVVCGSPLDVEVRVDGLELVAPVPDPADAEPGTGHVDVMLNGQDVAMVWETTIRVPDVEDGEYQLRVELSNADHTPVEPYAGALVYVDVSEAACSR